MVKKELPVYSIKEFGHESHEHDFYANILPRHLKHHHFVQAAHKHDFYLTVLFTKGTGTHEVDFIDYKVRPGSVFFLSPGQMHNWILSDDIDGYIFFHTKEFYDLHYQYRHISDLPFFSSIYNSPLLTISPAAMRGMIPLFEELIMEHRSSKLLKNPKICSLIDLLYIDLARMYSPVKQAREAQIGYMEKFRQLESLIDRHFKEMKSPSGYASMMNVTTRHLNRICKTCVNRTLSEIILDRIILEAKRMLVQPGHTIIEVANELGIFDQSYFTRIFKKSTGDTPLKFAGKYRK
jgi:AraC-like DNA-binding protein